MLGTKFLKKYLIERGCGSGQLSDGNRLFKKLLKHWLLVQWYVDGKCHIWGKAFKENPQLNVLKYVLARKDLKILRRRDKGMKKFLKFK